MTRLLCRPVALWAVFLLTPFAWAAPPAESLLPPTTKGFLSVPNVEQLRARWKETQLGQLVNDPVMKPFIEDLQAQIKAKLTKTDKRLGITWDDLTAVIGGEVCLAAIQPGGNTTQHAVAVIVDTTGHKEATDALMAKIAERLKARQAVRDELQIAGTDSIRYTIPPEREGESEITAYYARRDDLLIATDHRQAAEEILNRVLGHATDSLQKLPAVAATKTPCRAPAGKAPAHIRWFVEPFGYTEVVRAASGGRRKRGTDLLKVLAHQGFGAVKGLGGMISLATGQQEMLHYTMIYAPPLERETGAPNALEKYDLAARMLDFPNTSSLQPFTWVPRDLATHVTFNWKMKEAFEFSKSLVNELMGAKENEDLFEDILGSIATDRDGPQVDLRKELVAYLAQRVTMVTENRVPTTTDSERVLVAIELTDEAAVRRTVDKAMEVDPDARKHVIGEHVVWEIVNQQHATEVDELRITGGGNFKFENDGAPKGGEEKKHLPNMAITVAYNHLIVGTHLDYVIELLKREPTSTPLSEAADFQSIQGALNKLGALEDSFRVFTRTDDAYRPTYELIRQNKMPESKTFMGKMLNRFLGPEEEGVLRKQQIDGSKLPPYQTVRRYLGPAGMFVRSENDGWLMTGCLLSKEAPALAQKPDVASDAPMEK